MFLILENIFFAFSAHYSFSLSIFPFFIIQQVFLVGVLPGVTILLFPCKREYLLRYYKWTYRPIFHFFLMLNFFHSFFFSWATTFLQVSFFFPARRFIDQFPTFSATIYWSVSNFFRDDLLISFQHFPRRFRDKLKIYCGNKDCIKPKAKIIFQISISTC